MAGQKNIVVIWTVFVAFVDMSHVATWTERSRCENSLVLKLNVGPYARRMTNREDFPQASRTFGALHRQQGRVNLYTLKKEGERQRPLDEKLRPDLSWQSRNRNANWSQASSSSSTDWWLSGICTNHNKENGNISNGKSLSEPSGPVASILHIHRTLRCTNRTLDT